MYSSCVKVTEQNYTYTPLYAQIASVSLTHVNFEENFTRNKTFYTDPVMKRLTIKL